MFKCMKNFGRLLAVLCAGLVLSLTLSGCDDAPSTARYAVKAFSGGEVVGNYEAVSYSTGDGRVYANLANGRQNIVAGSFSVRRTDAGNSNNTARATKYSAELYSGGKVVDTVNAYELSGGDGKVFLSVSNSEKVIFGGSYVIRNIGVNLEGLSDGAKHKVTAFNEGVVIGTFYADSYSTGDDKIYLTVKGINSAVVIGGEYIVEQFR